MRFIGAARRRITVYAVCFFVVWPLLSVFLATLAASQLPYFDLSFSQAAMGVLGGAALLVGDTLMVAFLSLAGSLVFFSILSHMGVLAASESRQAYEAELALLWGGVVLATVCLFPSVLSCSLFKFVQPLPVWAVLAGFLLLVMVLSAYRGRPGKRLFVGIAVLAAGFLLPWLTFERNRMTPPRPGTPPTVLLGLDSLSLSDDVTLLRDWVTAKGGAWHTNIVSPGLLTNAVWSSLLLQKPVREHGVFHTFQGHADPAACTLVRLAKEQGYHTVAFFSDQFTCWLGSDCAFDEDRSGPKGWRQMATTLYANNSLLLPLVRPLLPMLPWSTTPPNQAGTFAYSLGRELSEIITQSSAGGKTLVLGHSIYLHVSCHPSLLDLSKAERWRVLAATVSQVQDRSFDWQDFDHPDDALPLRRWKVRHLQETVVRVIEETKFLEQGGKLALFSDHGDRWGLTPQTFKDPRFWNVLFATFNLPVYEMEKPVSLIDCGAILGLTPSRPFAPVVEYAMGNVEEWQLLGQSAAISWDGSVHLDEAVLASIRQRLESYLPSFSPFVSE